MKLVDLEQKEDDEHLIVGLEKEKKGEVEAQGLLRRIVGKRPTERTMKTQQKKRNIVLL